MHSLVTSKNTKWPCFFGPPCYVSALEVIFYNEMSYINLRINNYLLTYLLTYIYSIIIDNGWQCSPVVYVSVTGLQWQPVCLSAAQPPAYVRTLIS